MKKYFFIACILGITAFLSSCEYLEDLIHQGPIKQERTFKAFLSGFQEVPAVAASGAGQGIFTLNREGTEISYKLLVANTDKIKFAHIHMAPVGENGPIVADLLELQDPPTGLVNGVLAEGKIKAKDLKGPLAGKPLSDLIKAMETGNAYANIHTVDFPGGELRGQLRKGKLIEDYEFSAHLSGAEEVPPVTTDAMGEATYKFNTSVTELKFKVKISKIEDVRFSHIHLAPKGVNGGIIVTLRADKVTGPVNGDYAEGTITAADLSGNLQGGPLSILKEAIESGNTYTNVHTDKYPPGEIRGQIK